MYQIDTREALLDQLAIANLVQAERLNRDQHQWKQLSAAYHPDSVVRLGWFVGTGEEYAEASRRMEEKKGCWHLTHLMSPTVVRVNGDRAIAETNVVIIRRASLDSVLVDITIYGHFYSRVERREGVWGILTLDVIYEKDTLVLVNPADHLEISWEELEKGPEGYRFSTYNLRKLGYTVRTDSLYTTVQPERVAQLFAKGNDWLNQP